MNSISQKAKEIFVSVVDEVPPEEWDHRVDEACQGDDELRRRVHALLLAHAQPDSRLDHVAIDFPLTLDQPITEKPGNQIGPYNLLQQIGEGGMGVVYMAEQKQPVKRRVALKIIKPGMDSRQVIARFEAERQALSLMDHPNIARVLDAGSTETGRPYFVMELVNGIPVTQFCDEQHLTARERLELFIPICQAVQHAHQKGIIHRDIKPSNILVALYDGRPVPKVIDFGVAKATGGQLTDMTMFTGLGQIIGTLEYMSPEQAQLNQLDIDTRSDVYSLGVVLYELLTGDTPFDKQRLRSAALEELLRIIREEESPKPSTKLSGSDTLPSVAANRKIEPAKLSALVRGELDWIVMKALEKDRARRYETANGLASDIQRYLNDEPVAACPPSAGYRFRKFARRQKRVFISVGLVMSALVAGIAVSTWQAVNATRQRDRANEAERLATRRLDDAESQRQRAVTAELRAAENLRQALNAVDSMLTRVADETLANVPQLENVRRKLYEDALLVHRRLTTQVADAPRVPLETARAQRRVGWILFLQGQTAEADAELADAAELLAAVEQQSPGNAEMEIELARVRRLQGEMSTTATATRLDRFAEAIAILRPHVSAAAADRRVTADFGACLTRLASLHDKQGDHAAAKAAYEEAEQVLAQLVQQYPHNREASIAYAQHLQNFGIHFLEAGDWEAAEAKYQQAAAVLLPFATNDPADAEIRHVYASAMLDQATALYRQEKFAEADALFGHSIAVLDQLVADYPSFARYRLRLAGALMNAGANAHDMHELARAVARGEQAVTILEYLVEKWPTVREYHGNLGGALGNLAWLLSGQENGLERAEQVAERAIEQQRLALETPEQVSNFLMKNYQVLARIQMQRGRWAQAASTCQAGLQIVQQLKEKNPTDPDISFSANLFEQILETAKQHETDKIP